MTATAQAVDAPTWLTDLYRKVDARDTEGTLAAFAPGASMRYGSDEPMPGTDAIRAGLTWLFSSYTRICHEFRTVWETTGHVLLDATVTYGTADGREIAVPALTVIAHRDGVIDDLRVFIDPTPLRAA